MMTIAPHRAASTAFASALLVALVGCSPPPGGDTDTAADGSDTADSASPDTRSDTMPLDTADGSEDTTPPPDTDVGDGPAIGQFSYIRETADCNRNCVRGVKVNLVSLRIEDIGDVNRRESLSSDDVDTLREQYLTDMVLDKTKNGWECGSDTKYNGVFHKFEAVPNNDEFDPPEYTKTVAGCVPEDSSKPDAEQVQNIIDKLQSLENKYFGG